MKNLDRLSHIRGLVADDVRAYNEVYESCLRTNNRLLADVMSYVMSGRGKEIRSLLVLLSAKLSGTVCDKTLHSAVALELLHGASLLHDDVVDNADERRGRPTIGKQWGNKVAILSGDWILSRVIGILSSLRNVKILSVVAGVGESLSTGEIDEMHHGKSMWITEDEYYSIIEQKTACLFEACCKIGAITGGAAQRVETALTEYGKLLGMCFQMRDDVLDYSDSEELGKPIMHDVLDGKVTLPLIVALQRSPIQERARIKDMVELLSTGSMQQADVFAALQEIKSFVLRYDGVGYAESKMDGLCRKAIKVIDEVFEPSDLRRAMEDLAEYVVSRMG